MKVLTIYASYDTGEVSRVAVTEGFKSDNALFRADVLQDCVGILKKMYDEANEEWQRTMAEAAAKEREQ